MKKFTPTEEQTKIIDAPENCVVIAAPGSGKTYVVSEIIKKILAVIPDYKGVIAISYTNKASDELKRRSLVGGILPKASFFGTIDRFCFSELVASFGKQVLCYNHGELEVIDREKLTDSQKESLLRLPTLTRYDQLTNEHIAFLKELFHEGKVLLETIGMLANYVFDNSQACQLYLRARYESVIIDEYQDSGYEQHHLFTKLADLGLRAIAVGDLNQAIFGFAGKDMHHLESLIERKDFKYYPLLTNHRCHPSISNYAKSLIAPFLTGFTATLMEVDDIRIFCKSINGSESNLCSWIEQSTETFRQRFDVKFQKEICLLVRSNWKGQYISSLLQIPNRFVTTTDLDTEVSFWGLVFRRLLFFLFDKNDTSLEVLETFADVYIDKGFTKKAIRAIEKLKAAFKMIDSLSMLFQADSDNNKIIRGFIEVAEIIFPNRKNNRSINLLKRVISTEKELLSYTPPNDGEIQIMTFHKCKGLEFDIVIHLDLYSFILPSKTKKNGNWVIDSESLHQDINLHYVAITRARKACFLTLTKSRINQKGQDLEATPSEFLTLDTLSALEKLRIPSFC